MAGEDINTIFDENVRFLSHLQNSFFSSKVSKPRPHKVPGFLEKKAESCWTDYLKNVNWSEKIGKAQ